MIMKIVCFNSEVFNWKWLILIPAGPLREKMKVLKNYDMALINGKWR